MRLNVFDRDSLRKRIKILISQTKNRKLSSILRRKELYLVRGIKIIFFLEIYFSYQIKQFFGFLRTFENSFLVPGQIPQKVGILIFEFGYLTRVLNEKI